MAGSEPAREDVAGSCARTQRHRPDKRTAAGPAARDPGGPADDYPFAGLPDAQPELLRRNRWWRRRRARSGQYIGPEKEVSVTSDPVASVRPRSPPCISTDGARHAIVVEEEETEVGGPVDIHAVGRILVRGVDDECVHPASLHRRGCRKRDGDVDGRGTLESSGHGCRGEWRRGNGATGPVDRRERNIDSLGRSFEPKHHVRQCAGYPGVKVCAIHAVGSVGRQERAEHGGSR